MSRLRNSYQALKRKHFDGTQDWLMSFENFRNWYFDNTDLDPEKNQFSIRQKKRTNDWSGDNMKVVKMTNKVITGSDEDVFIKAISVLAYEVTELLEANVPVKLKTDDWRDVRDEVNYLTSRRNIQFNLERLEGYVLIAR